MLGCTMVASQLHRCCTTAIATEGTVPYVCTVAALHMFALNQCKSCCSFLLQLQQQVWKETLEFVSASVSSQTAAMTAAAGASSQAATTALGPAVAGLAAAQQPLGLRQKLKLLQQFLAWQQEEAVLPALALPQLPVQVRSSFECALCSCLSGCACFAL